MEQEHIEGVNVIVGRSLKMVPILSHLPIQLGGGHTGAGPLPTACVRKMREQLTQSVQRNGFSEKVSIRRKIEREVRFKVKPVAVESFEKPEAEGAFEAVSHQVMDPDPRQSSQCDFEGARPIDAALKGILLNPAIELAHNFVD